MYCPKCGRFVKVRATVNGFDEIVKIVAKCKKHGKVDVSDQDYTYEELVGD
jgi:uncharacterized radical SAM superfamily Fe-S cluster-containing enzyme